MRSPAVSVLLLALATPAWAGPSQLAVSIDGSETTLLRQRLLLDPGFQPSGWHQADVMWVVGKPTHTRWQQMLRRVKSGAGLVFVAGSQLPDLTPLGLQPTAHLETRVTLAVEKGATHLSQKGATHLSVTQEVIWPTAPQAGKRWTFKQLPGSPLSVVVSERTKEGSGSAVVLLGRLGKGRVAVVSLDLAHGSNRELVLWPYFNYLLYALS